MRKLKLFNLLLLPILFGGFALASQASNLKNEAQYVEVRAIDEYTVEDFLADYTAIRKQMVDANRNVCSATREEYNQIMEIFYKLSKENRQIAGENPDPFEPNYKISQVVTTLVSLYYASPVNNASSKPKLTQSTTIIIAVVVSIIGMSAISVLFILKNNKVIE